ncbi:MAG: hypothetical protein ACRDQX_01390 [Pseudonocardiaceae bacterium]
MRDADIGTIPPVEATHTEEAYMAAFFDRWLSGRDNHLLDDPSPEYPDMDFITPKPSGGG